LLPLPEQHEIGLKILIETRHTRTTPPDHRVTHQDHSRRAAVVQGKDWLTALLNDISNATVTITLSEKGFRDSHKKWTGNNLRDGGAMAAAIPSRDFVTAGNYVAAQLVKSSQLSRGWARSSSRA